MLLLTIAVLAPAQVRASTLAEVPTPSDRAFDAAPCSSVWVSPFSDVGWDHMFCTPIAWAATEEITNGYPDGTYRPNTTVTRGQYVAFLHAFVNPTFTAPPTPTFSDVPTTHHFYQAIEWAAATGVTNGYPDGTFRPGATVTRGQGVTLLHNHTNPTYTAPLTATFTDVPTTHPLFEPIEWANAWGITNGRPDNTFGPSDLVTRKALATFLYQHHGYNLRQAHADDPQGRLALGRYFGCAVTPSGGVRCWGLPPENQSYPWGTSLGATELAGISDVVSITAGEHHACGVLVDGTVRCWGNGPRTGTGTWVDQPTPVAVTGIVNAVAVRAGSTSTCAVLTDGTARCWGFNRFGNLGDLTTTYRPTPVLVAGLVGAVDIAPGVYHTCALREDGSVVCWGSNTLGQLGRGTYDLGSLLPLPVAGIDNVRELAAGDTHTCALTGAGDAHCWGENAAGQLGTGTTAPSPSPTPVTGLADAEHLSTGRQHSCAVLAGGAAQCWGANDNGQLGNGSSSSTTTPTAVDGLASATAVQVGAAHSCALLADGTATCWGARGAGQLGDGSGGIARPDARAVTDIGSAAAVTASSNHSCAAMQDGTARCWGSNTRSQLGTAATLYAYDPVAVSGLTGVTDIAGGWFHSCAVGAGATLRCWGGNGYGQLGLGNVSLGSKQPVAVPGLGAVADVAASTDHTCVVETTGAAWCWGANANGQLGDGTTTDRASPVAVSNLIDAVAIETGAQHTCSLLTDGSVRCWGDNRFGQLGDGTTTWSTVPVPVAGLDDAIAISVGIEHTCAVRSTGIAVCWGRNEFGQLGDGTTSRRYTPVTVSGLVGVIDIAAGSRHSCASLADGTARCWGTSDVGQVGNGTVTDVPTSAVAVTGLAGVTGITTGDEHACARLADATVHCWGSRVRGLGTASDFYATSPVSVVGFPT